MFSKHAVKRRDLVYMALTLADIASTCNVSKTLVSRIINNDSTLKIPETTREKVLNEIELQGYVPNQVARLLVTKNLPSYRKQAKLGYISITSKDKLGHPYFSYIIEGIHNEIEETDSKLSVVISGSEANSKAFWENLALEPLDGLILLGRIENEEIKIAIKNAAKYIVCMEDVAFDNASDFVGVDLTKTYQTAFLHLISLGYTDIGLLVGPFPDRVKYCLDYLKNKGISPNTNWIVDGDFNVNTTYSIISKTLKTQKPPRAFMSWNDEMAIGCIKALTENGYNVPKDVAIIGHDDINMASYVQVPLSTIRVYKRELGQLAVNTILERIKTQRKFPIRVEVPGKLIIRNSCGAKKSFIPN